LEALRAEGVYATMEEFKGRAPLRRHGLEIPVAAAQFDNPNLAADYTARSGGTTGPGTRVGISLDNVIGQAPHWVLAYDAHGVLGAPMALWRGVLPDGSGMNILLRSGALFGQPPVKWFTPSPRRSLRRNLASRLMMSYIRGVARTAGVAIPVPEPVPLDQARIVARWAAETAASHGRCIIRCNASMSMRVAVAARDEGLDLTGATIMGGGEPPTPAKVAEITRTGARWVPTYSFTEAGGVGVGCARPDGVDDVHFFKDLFALIQAPHDVPGSSLAVPAFYFTTLMPNAPKILLNAEIGDYGVVETRACGCPLHAHGFTEHLREIRSFSLLVAEGMTMYVSHMVRIVEEVLPAQFGGTALDYQMIEEEDPDGYTRLVIVVSPRIAIADDADVIRTVTAHTGGSARHIWNEARTFRVRRMEPVASGRAKLAPVLLLPRASRREP
jgi:hypothetical protein